MSGLFQRLVLFSNIGAAANGAQVNIDQGGRYVCNTGGTFGGTSFKLQLLGPDGTTWNDIPNSTLTAAGPFVIYLPTGAKVRGVTTAGTPVAFYAELGYAG